jgi:hypothetical protein
MNRPLLVIAFFAAATATLVAQEASQSSPYSGVSSPPPDEQIITDPAEQPAKPPAGHPMNAQPAAPAPQDQSAMPSAYPQANPAPPATYGTDNGLVQGAQPAPSAMMPSLANRAYVADPDGDIVHPAPLGPGELREGTMIRVRLLNELSSSFSEQGEPFRSRVASDVMEGGEVLIPAGSEISGHVVDVSKGHFAGHGTLMLKPETVTLPNGETFRLHAMVASTPGTHTRVGAEGVIGPDSHKKRDGIEYGGAVGTGVVAGAILGGPVGALAGGLVGAGLVTTHILVSHPQAHLESGDVLMLTLTEQMHMTPAGAHGE